MKLETKRALGLYSDGSALGISAAVIETDGIDLLSDPISIERPYSPDLRSALINLDLSNATAVRDMNHEITTHFLNSAREIMDQANDPIHIIGLSGHTIQHDASLFVHSDLGDAHTLAKTLKTPIVDHFIQSDMAAGGVGSPILSSFWQALLQTQEKPIALLSLGGINKVTYIGPVGELIGFDIGIGTIVLDYWIKKHTGEEMDFDGLLGAKGNINDRVLKKLLSLSFLHQHPPKAISRHDFDGISEQIEGMSTADGAATLTAFIAHSIQNAASFLPDTPTTWVATGGGTHNPTLMRMIRHALQAPVTIDTDILSYTADLNACGYAFLAVRSLMNLPISFPSTTGVSVPLSGGRLTVPQKSN